VFTTLSSATWGLSVITLGHTKYRGVHAIPALSTAVAQTLFTDCMHLALLLLMGLACLTTQ
jgi:hypothetical protein